MSLIKNRLIELMNQQMSDNFVCRQEEMDFLNSALQRALAGKGHFILINGEAGVGKSKLVEVFLSTLSGTPVQCQTVHFHKNVHLKPYKPFQELIFQLEQRKLSGTSESQTERDSGTEDQQLNLQELYSLQNQKVLIQQDIVSALSYISNERPLVIALEDLHNIELTTWQFIHYLIDKISEKRILLLATLRQDGNELAAEKKPIYSDILQRINRDRLLSRLTLNRFSEKQSRIYITSLFKRMDFSHDFINTLHQLSGGIPGELKKYLNILLETGSLYMKNDIWFNESKLSREELVRAATSENTKQAISRKLQGLTEDQQLILNYMALMEGPVSPAVLASVVPVSRLKFLKEISRLQALKILLLPDENIVQFRTTALQGYVREQIPADQMAKMHAEIADNIKHSSQIDETDKIYLLFYHYRHAGEPSLAVKYSILATEQAIRNFAFAEANRVSDESLALIENHPGLISDQNQKIKLFLTKAWLTRVVGAYEQSLENCRRVMELCQSEISEETKLKVSLEKGFTYFRLNDWENARTNLEYCLNSSYPKNDFENSMIHYGMGNVFFELSLFDEAKSFYELGLQYARQVDARDFIALISNNLAAVENVRGNHVKAIAFLSQAIPIYTKLGDSTGLARIYNNVGMTYAEAHDWEKANSFYGKSLSHSDVMGLTPLKSITFINRALALTHLNKLDEAREYGYKAKRLLQQLNDDLGLAEFEKLSGMISTRESNWEQATHAFEKALQMYKRLNNTLGIAETQYELGLMEFARNEREEALNWFRRSQKTYQSIGIVKKAKSIEQKILEIEESNTMHMSMLIN